VDELGVSELAEQARVFIGAGAEYSWAPTSGRNFFLLTKRSGHVALGTADYFSLFTAKPTDPVKSVIVLPPWLCNWPTNILLTDSDSINIEFLLVLLLIIDVVSINLH
jgi:hypothetical protein